MLDDIIQYLRISCPNTIKYKNKEHPENLDPRSLDLGSYQDSMSTKHMETEETLWCTTDYVYLIHVYYGDVVYPQLVQDLNFSPTVM